MKKLFFLTLDPLDLFQKEKLTFLLLLSFLCVIVSIILLSKTRDKIFIIYKFLSETANNSATNAENNQELNLNTTTVVQNEIPLRVIDISTSILRRKDLYFRVIKDNNQDLGFHLGTMYHYKKSKK